MRRLAERKWRVALELIATEHGCTVEDIRILKCRPAARFAFELLREALDMQYEQLAEVFRLASGAASRHVYLDLQAAPPPITLKGRLGEIFETEAGKLGYTVAEIRSLNRHRDVVLARSLIAYRLKQEGYPVVSIAGALRRHHSTVISLIRKISNPDRAS